MRVFVMTSLLAADCSMSLLLQWETRGRRWFEGVSVVQPVPRSMMTVGVVDLKFSDWLQIISHVGRRVFTETLVHQHGMLVRDSLRCTQPMESVKQWCDVFTSTCLEHQTSRCVHDSL